MSIRTQPRPRVSKAGLFLSVVFHLAAIALLVLVAAREGLFGLPPRQLTATFIRERLPDQPPARDRPSPEPVSKTPTFFPERAPAVVPSPSPSKTETAPPHAAVVVTAPAAVDMPAFAFDDGGKTVQTSTDPASQYRSFVEFSLRSRWNRPSDVTDEHFVAEIEIAVDPSGHVSDPRWIRKSGDVRWDASAMEVIEQTRNLDRLPPPGFPPRVTIRFDVVPSVGLLAR